MKDASVQPPNSGLHGAMGWLVPQEGKGRDLGFSPRKTTTTTATKTTTKIIIPTPLSELPTPLASSQQLQLEQKLLKNFEEESTQPNPRELKQEVRLVWSSFLHVTYASFRKEGWEWLHLLSDTCESDGMEWVQWWWYKSRTWRLKSSLSCWFLTSEVDMVPNFLLRVDNVQLWVQIASRGLQSWVFFEENHCCNAVRLLLSWTCWDWFDCGKTMVTKMEGFLSHMLNSWWGVGSYNLCEPAVSVNLECSFEI